MGEPLGSGTISLVPKLLLAALLVVAALAVGAAQGAAPPAGNRAANGGAEAGTGSTDGSVVPVPRWTTTGTFTVVQYGSSGYPAAQPHGGANFFAGGQQPPSSAEQTIDLSGARKAIDAGRIDARVGALEAGPATLAVSLEDGSGHLLSQRNLKAGGGAFERVDELIPVPPKARSATLTMKARSPDALFDNVSLALSRRSVPRPERGKTVLVEPAKGVTVLLRRGNRKVITRPQLVPLGTEIDTSKGTVTIVSATDRFGAETQRGSFSEGVLAVGQVAGDTEISLGGRGTRACNKPRRLVSRATSGFMVLAGAMASRASGFFAGGPGRAVWVAEDRCTAATINTHAGHVEVIALGSRDASGQRAHHLFTTGRGLFTTRGRNSSATVRGRVVAP
ncbi:MAG: hypothetical protein QOC77_2826 [Thermoleophilaceae bacterium]|nr:hypothetical protein [Thermoleophilaceae bacterium]